MRNEQAMNIVRESLRGMAAQDSRPLETILRGVSDGDLLTIFTLAFTLLTQALVDRVAPVPRGLMPDFRKGLPTHVDAELYRIAAEVAVSQEWAEVSSKDAHTVMCGALVMQRTFFDELSPEKIIGLGFVIAAHLLYANRDDGQVADYLDELEPILLTAVGGG